MYLIWVTTPTGLLTADAAALKSADAIHAPGRDAASK
jgi:hypothetical protein